MVARSRRNWLTRVVVLAAYGVLARLLGKVCLAEEGSIATLRKTDRCPVCGMFVYKYPKWVAQMVFLDGTAYFYDGAKDMFKHYFNVSKYTTDKTFDQISQMYVTDYYEVELIDAKTAYYVIGSDVLGPMGHELIPFKDLEAAREFMEDHKGKTTLRFQDVTEEVVKSLDPRS